MKRLPTTFNYPVIYPNGVIIYCETEEKPSDWSADWDVFGKTSEERLTIYWSRQWEYDANGNPVPLS